MSEKNNKKNLNQDLREELHHSSSGNDLERKSLTFSHKRELKNSTISYEPPSKPDDIKFNIEDD